LVASSVACPSGTLKRLSPERRHPLTVHPRDGRRLLLALQNSHLSQRQHLVAALDQRQVLQRAGLIADGRRQRHPYVALLPEGSAHLATVAPWYATRTEVPIWLAVIRDRAGARDPAEW